MQSQILIVDDEESICSLLMREFNSTGLTSEATSDPLDALDRLAEQEFDLLITDLQMPGIDGLELLYRAKQLRPECDILMMTAHASVATVREALTHGAVDYLTKPFSIAGELRPLVKRLLAEHALEAEIRRTSARPNSDVFAKTADDEIVAEGKTMSDLLDRARRVARSDVPVLLQGESGTGKEVIANLIHRNSPRREQAFVKVNCAALPENLIESELFGYTKGAFTGANRSRAGLFEVADGGTILLDEVGEISMAFQPKLLRVLQEGEFHRIGDSARPVTVDVRIIAATNRDLASAVDQGTFRDDLFYRLNVVPIDLPPLRQHIEDLVPLFMHYCALLGHDEPNGHDVQISPEAMMQLTQYSWPGNVREVINAVKFSLVMSEGRIIDVEHLPVAIQEFNYAAAGAKSVAAADAHTLAELEMDSIVQAMTTQNFNRTQAARMLGITRRSLGYRIAKYDLEATLEIERAVCEAAPARAMRKVRTNTALPTGSLKP